MMYVNANYYTSSAQVGRGVRYISHREEGLPQGTTRPLYGLGERYRELRGDENAIVHRLRADAAPLREPHFYRLKLTVNDAVAGMVAEVGPVEGERAMREAIERTFRGALRKAQGVFVVHYHGGHGRPAGHPHVHVNLSPILVDGRALRFISKPRLERIKERWEREVTGAAERRLKLPQWALTPLQERLSTREPWRAGLRLGRGLAGRALTRLAGPPAGLGLRLQGDLRQSAAGHLGRALAWRLLESAVPAPLRIGLRLARALSGLRTKED